MPPLDIQFILRQKYRRAAGRGGADDSNEHSSLSSVESLDSKGRPKRLPRPRLAKKILDSYSIQTGARNIIKMERHIRGRERQLRKEYAKKRHISH